MRRLGITAKLALSSAITLLALGAAMSVFSISQLRSLLYGQLLRHAEAEAVNWIEANLFQITVTRDPSVLSRSVAELKRQRGFAYVRLVDGQGSTIAGDAPVFSEEGAPAQVPELASRLRTVRTIDGRRFFDLATPVRASGALNPELGGMFEVAGAQSSDVLHVGVDQDEIYTALAALVPKTLLFYGALVFAALTISVLLARRIASPLTEMAEVANRIAGGRLDARVRKGAALRDEVGQLARNFNEMAERLAELHAGLEKKVHERTAELERANSRLRELDELKSQFLSTVSHELRTPLTSIKAFAEILLDSPIDDATRRHFLGIIDKESDRLTRLIAELLDLSRIDRGGQVRWRMARIDLVSTIKQALAPLYSHTRVGNIHLRFNPPPPLPVVADADRIQQVITNLVGNAIKYTPPGGRIEVAAVVVDGKVRVSVADTGPGMSQEVCAHVFDRFYRASGDTSSGLGLGLTIAREIVIHHKGDIWVESEPGAGSTFFFTLPLAAEAAITTTDAKESAGM